MRIKPKHLKVIIAAFADKRATIEEAKLEYLSQSLSFLRFAWDTFWFVRIDGDSSRWVVTHLYPYMDDTHVETAIKAALKASGIRYE